MSSQQGGRPPATRVRVAAEASAVRAVRRLVDRALADWGHEDLVDDVALSLTELATNATLHTDTGYLDVELSLDGSAVRVAVVNAGTVPADSIAARVAAAPAPSGGTAEVETMTGRGLLIVSALAQRWGIEELPQGTRVWADFVRGHEPARQAPVVTAGGSAETSPAPGMVVRLQRCPARLLLAHDEQLADLVRDLTLSAAGQDGTAPDPRLQQALAALRAAARSWEGARSVADRALREGLSVVDVDLAVGDPAGVSSTVRGRQEAVAAAEAMAADGLLISLPAAPEVRIWRAWVAEEMTQQAATGRDPRPFDSFFWPA